MSIPVNAIDAAVSPELSALIRKFVKSLDIEALPQEKHIPKSAIDAGNKAGGNTLGLESIDQMFRNVGIETAARFSTVGKANGSYLPFLYMNDATRDQSPLASYPAANIAKLKTIAQKYDPKGVFQKLQNDGFLLSKL
ncbi:hypothetical protein BDV95DRAFT_610863 [Massariosphaeria phaeospora]|uniref:Berberine/berberine-like domain-containing protein n=1 Tax=Massariosphaeria phaeospora TaxID=100035 RepID=A0A7C8I426_9PLEO|nr:hypothetical protein BDV95DRAFT_610863 [Massariosphaeria phaeospora]